MIPGSNDSAATGSTGPVAAPSTPISLAGLAFASDLAEVGTSESAGRWTVLRIDGELALWVTMAPASRPEERFHACLRWEKYPDHAPSVKFGDPTTGRLDDPHLWPTGGPFRPTAFCLCVNYTAEGFALHPEWVRDPLRRWDPRGNAVLRVINLLQNDLDLYFGGRHP